MANASGWRARGAKGRGGAPAGDLYLVVRLAPHPRYRIDGRDIYVDLPLSPWEAALGVTVAIDTPGGEAKVRVKAGTSSGKRLRLRGRGLPNPRGSTGDLFAEVRIMVPPSLTKEERRLFEELAAISTFDPQEGAMTFALVRARRLDLETLRPSRRSASRSRPPVGRPRAARRRTRFRGRAVVSSRRHRRRVSTAAASRWPVAQLRLPRGGRRSARPHHRTGGGAA